jgi:hypothetical protein
VPAKRSNRGQRVKRQPIRRPVRQAPAAAIDQDYGNDEVAALAQPAPAPVRSRPAPRATAQARTRSRAPAQIVIANYDFLRHDLRLLLILAPTLIVIMVILSFVVS